MEIGDIVIAKIISEEFPNITYTRKNTKTNELETKLKKWRDCNICKILNNKAYLGIWEPHKNTKNKLKDYKYFC